MLEQVCDHIHNYFISAAYPAQYSIESGVISPAPPLKEGQRFWICGSDLNDGVYTYHEFGLMNDDDKAEADLMDEVFSGTICAMAVPVSVIRAVEEGLEWKSKYGDSIAGPYSSETVQGVYSYTKSEEFSDGQNALGLPKMITRKFDRWRKTCL